MSPSTPWTEEEMSYTYIARLHIKPEMKANFRQAIADLMEIARHDPGTLDYQVFTLADDPYTSLFYESYVDAYAGQRHRTGPLSGPIVARVAECLAHRGFSHEYGTSVTDTDTQPSGAR